MLNLHANTAAKITISIHYKCMQSLKKIYSSCVALYSNFLVWMISVGLTGHVFVNTLDKKLHVYADMK